MSLVRSHGIRVPSRQSIFDFKLKIQNQNFCVFRFSNTNLKIENQPFFSDCRFFSFLFVAENVTLKINFFQKISIFSFPFFSSFLPIENRKMKIFELLILI